MMEVELQAPALIPEQAQRLARGIEERMAALMPASLPELLKKLPAFTLPAPNSAAQLLGYFAVLLQRWAGLPLQGQLSENADGSHLAFEYRIPQTGRVCAELATLLVTQALHPQDLALARRADEKLREFISSFVEHKLVASYWRAAEARGIPVRVPVEGMALLKFGQGRFQRSVLQNFTNRTPQMSTSLSTRKNVAAQIFRAHGLPAPRQFVVADIETAVRAARAIGFPVVVKPAAKDFGTAVSVGMRDEASVREAFAIAVQHGPVLVEEFIPGDQHRFTIVEGRVSSVRRHKPAHVVGDGGSTIRGLIDAANRLPRYKPLALDEQTLFVLRSRGLSPESIPAKGQEVLLRTQGNLHMGGTMEVVTDIVHPDNLKLALRAAELIGIDVAGLDFITTDISRSYHEVGGGICEINVTPAFVMGEEEELLAKWYPAGKEGRIPLVVLLDPDTPGAATTIAEALRADFQTVSLATRDGIFLNDDRIGSAAQSAAQGDFIALYEPSAGAAILECSSGQFIERGLQFDRCDLLVMPRAPDTLQQTVLAQLAPLALHKMEANTPEALATHAKEILRRLYF